MLETAHNAGSQQFRPQLCPHSQVASLCYTEVLPLFRSRIPGFGLDHNERLFYIGMEKGEILTFNNGIDRTSFLTETAVDAFGHINIW